MEEAVILFLVHESLTSTQAEQFDVSCGHLSSRHLQLLNYLNFSKNGFV